MDVRLHRASKAAALTFLIIFTTFLILLWATNPPSPESWEMEGYVSYSTGIFEMNLPTESHAIYDAEVDSLQNTTSVYVEISTEIVLTHGVLSFDMVSGYHTPHSKFSITDYRKVNLSSSASFENWSIHLQEDFSPYWLHFYGLNETSEQDQFFPIVYTLQMVWNSSLTLVEERDNNTSFLTNFTFWIHFRQSQFYVDPALFSYLIIGEGLIGFALMITLYRIDKPVVID